MKQTKECSAPDSSDSKHITIVTGIPRSGTSMLMQVLHLGGMPLIFDDMRKADLHNPHGYYEWEEIKKIRYESQSIPLMSLVGHAIKIIYLLLYNFPFGTIRCSIINVRRNLSEVVASQRRMLTAMGQPIGMDDEFAIALFEKERMKFEDWIEHRPNSKVLNVEYREVVDNPEYMMVELNSFLGGSLDPTRMMKGVDKSLYRKQK